MNTDTQHYRASLHEARDNTNGETVWIIRFLHSNTKFDKSKLVWFAIPAGQSWFADTEDHQFFWDLVRGRRHSAIRFARLQDAAAFLEILRPAQLHNEAEQAS